MTHRHPYYKHQSFVSRAKIHALRNIFTAIEGYTEMGDKAKVHETIQHALKILGDSDPLMTVDAAIVKSSHIEISPGLIADIELLGLEVVSPNKRIMSVGTSTPVSRHATILPVETARVLAEIIISFCDLCESLKATGT